MKKNLIYKNNNIIDAINAIESTSKRLAVVISSKNILLGTITDGDIRRHLIRGNSFNSSVANVMNSNPVKIQEATSPKIILNIALSKIADFKSVFLKIQPFEY